MMRRTFLCLIASCLSLIPLMTLAGTTKITCVGDSLTQGNGASDPNNTSYPAVLGQLLQADGSYQVGNFGSGGAHLLPYSGIYSYTNTTVFLPSVNFVGDVIIIMLGTNDGADDGQHIIPEFTNSYDLLISQYTSGRSPAPRIIIATPPWVPITNGPWSAALVNDTITPIVRSYAATRGYTLVDINALTWGHSEWSSDGMVHYNDAGYQAMAGAFHAAVTNGVTTLSPLMSVSGNSNSISDGASSVTTTNGTAFGSTLVSNSVDHTFRIQNAGTATLTLTGAPLVSISGANASDFNVITQPNSSSIATGNYVDFTVRFTPSAAGARSATISILNNDSPRSPFDFAVTGSGSLPAPSVFTAYNDVAWISGQLNSNITTYGIGSSGTLVDFASDIALGVQVSMTGVNAVLWPGSGAGYAPTGTPAAQMIPTNIVDSVIHYYYDSATMTFSGLTPTNFYTFVLYANRDGGYTDRYTTVTIQSADAFTNNSTVGAASQTSTTTTIFTGSSHGNVFRYDRVNPGSDGTVTFQLTGYKPCLNAFMVQTPSTNAASTNSLPPPPVTSDWTAYNDTAWTTMTNGNIPAGDPASGVFSTNSPWTMTSGHLMDASTASQLAAQVSFAGSVPCTLLDRAYSIPAGSDAESVFAGHIGTNCAANWTGGNVLMTVSGLDPARQYNVVLWSTRGADTIQYSNRFTDITISGADSFINHSSSGVQLMTTVAANDGTRVRSPMSGGRVARYDSVSPGSDGTILFTLTAGSDATFPTNQAYATNGYLNAFMIQTVPLSSASTNTIPDSWKIQYFGNTNVVNGGTFEDFDHDGFSNFAEWRAGTSPTNPSSLLEFFAIQAPTNNTLVLSWPGVTGKTYTIQQNTNLLTAWTTQQSGIPGIQPTTVHTVAVSSAGQIYWRVKVE